MFVADGRLSVLTVCLMVMLPQTRLGKRSPFGALVNAAVSAAVAQTGQDTSDPGLSTGGRQSSPAPKVSHETLFPVSRDRSAM